MVYFQGLCHLALGEALLRAGRREEAYVHAERALAHDALQDVAEAAAYRQPLALAEGLGMRPLQAHCHRGLGTLYAATGQRELARAGLAAAIEMYQSMDITLCLPQTEATLAQVEG